MSKTVHPPQSFNTQNFSIPLVGRYEEDTEGGAFYVGDDEDSCASQGLYVNAWRPLPEPYRAEDV